MAFFDNLENFGQATAFTAEDGGSLTYQSTAEAADSFGSHLSRRGLIFILAGNNIASVIGYIGCLRFRMPAALLPETIQPDLLSNLLRRYQPEYVWLPRNRAFHVSEMKELYALGDYVLLTNSAASTDLHPDLALLMTTSGSTGSAKFVRLSYANISANAASIAEYLEIRGDDKAITTLPSHYVYGLSVINSQLQSGASVLLTNASLMEKRFWDLFKAQAATTMAGVPYTYELLKRLHWDQMDLPSLRVLTQAGGKLSTALVKEFAGLCSKKGIRFYVMYGAAEATARMSYLTPDQALEKPGSIGMPIPGGEFWIEDDAGNTVTHPDVVGELFYRGANVSLGYAIGREDLSVGDERKGVLRTGDLARRDSDGTYYIAGRKSRFIKLFGNRVSLEEVEQFVRNAGIECACAGDDEALRIYITNPSMRTDAVSVAQRFTQLHHSAFRAVVIDRIPRNDAGKIIYAQLP
jgi:acyl-CoA synthetase (AMP-forming)/AMP-acid ligase II